MSADGTNFNEYLTGIGRFKEVRRTAGVSTTDLTGKLLQLIESDADNSQKSAEPPMTKFFTTATLISNFSNKREPKMTDEIVYIALSCDLMHPGVITRLKAARAQGDFLYVGLWDDEVIKYYRGDKYPL